MNIFTLFVNPPDIDDSSGVALTILGLEMAFDSEDRYSVTVDGVEIRLKDPIYHIESQELEKWMSEN